MDALQNSINQHIKHYMHTIAKWLHKVSKGRITPNQVTLTGFMAHIIIAVFIIQGQFIGAALLLIVFGLFDALDGALARVQKKANSSGMVLDATTDRAKEIILYAAIAYALIMNGNPEHAVWAVLACGVSLLVSFIKAKGETALSDTTLTPNQMNRVFQGGLFRFEVRMLVIILGLLFNTLLLALIVITVFGTATSLQRLHTIMRTLNNTHD